MNDYELCFNLIVKLKSDTAEDIIADLNEITENLGVIIHDYYDDFLVYPCAMELADSEDQSNIIHNIRYDGDGWIFRTDLKDFDDMTINDEDWM